MLPQNVPGTHCTVKAEIGFCLAAYGEPVSSEQEFVKLPGVLPAVQLNIAVVPENLEYVQLPDPGSGRMPLPL